MTAQTGYVSDALVAELVRAAHERGVRAGLAAAAQAMMAKAQHAHDNFNRYGPDDPSQAARFSKEYQHTCQALRAIRSLDPATIKEDADGRE